MKSFSDLNRSSMDLLADKINPLISSGMIGHLWTARFELACIIERIEEWIETDALDMFEIQQARELAAFFRTLPEAGHSSEECIAAMKAETLKWTGGKNAYARTNPPDENESP